MIPDKLLTPLYNRFYEDYIINERKTQDFLAHPNLAKWADICLATEPASSIHQSVKQILADQNSDLTSDKAKKNIKTLNDERCVIVITGQQLGLLGSPMYTLYKALSTVQLSDELNRRKTGYRFVPVFWLESEDHDFEEVNHLGLWDMSYEPRTIIYRGENRGKVPLRYYTFGPVVEKMITQIENTLQTSDFTADLIQQIRLTCTEGSSWLSTTREFLKLYLDSTGLIFFQPGATEIKEISVDFFKNFLTHSADIREQLTKRSEQLAGLGYDNQISDIPQKTYVHLEDGQSQRMHLYAENEGFVTRETGRTYSLKEMLQLLRSHPDKFSTAVASRPVLQSWLLPVAAYIAGPAEIAYWAQLGGIFEKLGIRMPVVCPRITATLIEPKIQRFLEKHQPDVAGISKRTDDFIDFYFKKTITQASSNPFSKVRNNLTGMMSEIKNYMKQLDPTLVSIAEKTEDRIYQQIEQLENRSVKAQEQKDQILLSHLRQIHTAFFPGGAPQERFISPVYFLNKFGMGFTEKISEKLAVQVWDHQIIQIEAS